jgi:hypothetical protein
LLTTLGVIALLDGFIALSRTPGSYAMSPTTVCKVGLAHFSSSPLLVAFVRFLNVYAEDGLIKQQQTLSKGG